MPLCIGLARVGAMPHTGRGAACAPSGPAGPVTGTYTDRMRARPFKPRQLDVEAFAEHAASLADDLPLGQFQRLVDLLHPGAPAGEPPHVAWQARGERRKVRGHGEQTWLHLRAGASLDLTCQRCMQAVTVTVDIDRAYRFVADEAAAAEADIDAEEDLLATSRSFDLLSLVEDELLLSLPIVPRHAGSCPEPLHVPASVSELEPDPEEAAPRPFDALAALKRAKTSGSA